MTTLVIFDLLSTAVGGLVGGAFNTVSGALGGLGRTATSVAQTAAPAPANSTDPFASIEQSLRGSTGNDPAALRDTAIASMRASVTGNQVQANDAREQAAQALARSQNIPIEEARTRVAGYEKQYREDGRPGQAASDAGCRHGRQGRLSRSPSRQPRPSSRRPGSLGRRTPRCGRSDHHGAVPDHAGHQFLHQDGMS